MSSWTLWSSAVTVTILRAWIMPTWIRWVATMIWPRWHDPAIPRSMSFCDTCVAPRYSNGPASGRRNTGAEAFELEGMNPCYIDIDGFWSKGADIKSPESAPIAN